MEKQTFAQFLLDEQRLRDVHDNEFVLLLNDIATACKSISRAMCKGALQGVMGRLESENIQGETQKQLDVISNEIFI
jgi:fructose-1,6-bisphosphatase I